MLFTRIFIIIMCVLCVGCSDFHRKDFVHIPSAHNSTQKTQKENAIQAMRKGQILDNNRTRVLMIVRYMNEVSKDFVSGSDEVFLVEMYARDEKIAQNRLSLTLKNTYKSIEAYEVLIQDKRDLGQFAPDIVYNDIYKVSFSSIGFRGRDSLKLIAHIKGIGDISFDFGYIKLKGNLAR